MVLSRQTLLDIGNRFRWIQILGANLGTVHNSVASVQLEGIVKLGEALLRRSISAILDPSVRLHQNGRPQVLVGIPPVGRT